MDERKWLSDEFEQQRTRLRAVAYRMLGSLSEADDAVQEAWLRLSGTERSEVNDLGAWLTTVVARISLNMLRSRKTRGETPMQDPAIELVDGRNPENEALLGSTIGLALLVVLDALKPAERVAFVLHDVFGMSFEDVAPIVGRNADAARQLASRARRRIQERKTASDSDLEAERSVVDAFVAAARDGDFDGLVAVLHPDIVLRAGSAEKPIEIRGATQVAGRAQSFSRAGMLRVPVLVNGRPGLLCLIDGKPYSVMAFTVRGPQITEIEIVADPARVASLDLTALEKPR
jgi:RNA polymerase sigma-70 factor (ECF subfamily)